MLNTKLFFDFLNSSKTAYHTVAYIKARLDSEGSTRLLESEKWELTEGGKYYVVRDGSSIIAFRNNGGGFMIAASHSDFPGFRVKADMKSGAYVKLDVEKYGGLINYSWLDRPLNIAGRAVVKSESGLDVRLVTLDKKVTIPSLAIHMNRSVNESLKLNPASDLLPLAGLGVSSERLMELAAEKLGVSQDSIVSHELFLANADEAVIVGLVSLIGTLTGTFGGILVSNKLTIYRIEQLEKKVEKHNLLLLISMIR